RVHVLIGPFSWGESTADWSGSSSSTAVAGRGTGATATGAGCVFRGSGWGAEQDERRIGIQKRLTGCHTFFWGLTCAISRRFAMIRAGQSLPTQSKVGEDQTT